MSTEAERNKTAATASSQVSISDMLILPDASQAVAWYGRAFGARELWNLGGVAGLEIGGAPFFLHEVNPDNPDETSPIEAGRASTRIELFVDDPDAVLAIALSFGGTLGSPIEEHVVSWAYTARALARPVRSSLVGRRQVTPMQRRTRPRQNQISAVGRVAQRAGLQVIDAMANAWKSVIQPSVCRGLVLGRRR